MPATVEFVADFFGDKRGVYRYLSELLVPGEEGSYKLQPHNVVGSAKPTAVFRNGDLAAYSVRVIHGGVPALAWRIEIGDKLIVFSGDTNGEGGLTELAANADLFVAHNAVPEGAVGIERNLHMPPSVIGQIAADARVKQLVLSHRMLRTLGKESRHRHPRSKRYFPGLWSLPTTSIVSFELTNSAGQRLRGVRPTALFPAGWCLVGRILPPGRWRLGLLVLRRRSLWVSRMDVAASATDSRQYLPVLPGRSKSSARWPQKSTAD